jgi:hypothetical protein
MKCILGNTIADGTVLLEAIIMQHEVKNKLLDTSRNGNFSWCLAFYGTYFSYVKFL